MLSRNKPLANFPKPEHVCSIFLQGRNPATAGKVSRAVNKNQFNVSRVEGLLRERSNYHTCIKLFIVCVSEQVCTRVCVCVCVCRSSGGEKGLLMRWKSCGNTTNELGLKHTHTQTHTHTLSLSLSHTHTHTQKQSAVVYMSS